VTERYRERLRDNRAACHGQRALVSIVDALTHVRNTTWRSTN
jgi:hypothetical protein